MKIYIAGRVTGDPNYKRKFSHATLTVKDRGHVPLTSAMLPLGLEEADYMRISLAMIESADLVLFLSDFNRSEGAVVEWLWCQKTGKAWDFFVRWEAEFEPEPVCPFGDRTGTGYCDRAYSERCAPEKCEPEEGNLMKAIFKQPGKPPEIVEIEDTLEALQEKVGGYIEAVTMAKNACVICNKEGRLRELPYNITLLGTAFVGPILVAGIRDEDLCDLEDIEYLRDQIERHAELEAKLEALL